MEFVDLKTQYAAYKEEMDAEIQAVIDSARFIGGPVIGALEQELAAYAGVKHAIGCSSGTDALLLGLMAKGIGPGDEVILPDFTFIATAEVVSVLGATPVFADIDSATYNLDPAGITAHINDHTKGIIVVSLFGQCADCDAINAIAKDRGLWVIEDAAQSFGALSGNRRSCSFTEIATTSFFPAKPLGCYGDGGAVFTNDDDLAAKIRMLLNHGQRARYDHAIVGVNGRLDAIQAAVVRVKLRHFDDELARRREVAGQYDDLLRDTVSTPTVVAGNQSTWAQYSVRTKERDAVVAQLKEGGIPIAIHYPKPLSQQDAFADADPQSCPVARQVSGEIFSIPMHPFLTRDEVTLVAESVIASVASVIAV